MSQIHPTISELSKLLRSYADNTRMLSGGLSTLHRTYKAMAISQKMEAMASTLDNYVKFFGGDRPVEHCELAAFNAVIREEF